MATEWTKAQLDAVTGTGNLLVSAGAGSGKTAVLAERITRLIAGGAEVTDFLVVTFTNAAAADMKKKIARSLMRAAAEAGEKDAERLAAAAAAVPMASISTLHAFCGALLRRHFHLAGLDPAFRGMDESDSAAMKRDAMDALLAEAYGGDDQAAAALDAALGGEDRLAAAIEGTYTFMNKRPDPDAWLDSAAAIYAGGLDRLLDSSTVRELTARLRRRLTAALGALTAAGEDTPEKIRGIIEDDALLLEAALAARDAAELLAALPTGARAFRPLDWRGASPMPDESVINEVKRARQQLKDTVKQAAATLDAVTGDAGFAADRPLIDALVALTRRYRDIYTEAKRERGAIDFDDMEHLALKVLQNPDVRGEYRRRFSYIMVDEYQDVNPVQEAVINAVRRSDDLFLVGDVKQSIYSFRLAEPALFLNKYAQYSGGAEGRAVDLTANFRSSEPVIRAVNSVFSALMSRECGELDYDERAALVCGRGEKTGLAELDILDLAGTDDEPEQDDEGDEPSDEQLDAMTAEAQFVAERIRGLVGTVTVGTGDAAHIAGYGDIAILLRVARGVAPQWVETLTREGIPVYSEVNGLLTDAIEIRTFVDLLRIIDNRRQDIPLADVMLSPIGGFTAGELAELRCAAPDTADFLDCIEAAGGDTGEKAAAFLAKLARWRDEARLRPVDELIYALLAETHYAEYVAALPGGKRRARNLRALAATAARAAESGYDSVAAFVAYMDAAGRDMRETTATIGRADVVRIMSVHMSKGLEFPIVFLCDLQHNFLFGERMERALFDAECGIALKLDMPFSQRKNALWPLIDERRRRKTMAEFMRVLYVAMTRARDMLIMTGSSRALEKRLQKLAGPITPAAAAKARNQLDWLLMAALGDGGGRQLRELIAAPPVSAPASLAVNVIHATGSTALLLPPMTRPRFVTWAREAEAAGGGEAARRFEWQYPFAADTLLPAKTTVTGVAGTERELTERPAFMETGAPLSATDRGTAAHKLMQYIPAAAHTAETVAAALAALTETGALTEAEAAAVDCGAVADFFASPLGRRLAASPRAERELEFNYRVAASRLYDGASDREILLQGVIDCAFIENGAWVIIDYKTDRVRTTAAETAGRHRRQLTLYAEALAALTGRPVTEAWIHLLRTGDSVRLI